MTKIKNIDIFNKYPKKRIIKSDETTFIDLISIDDNYTNSYTIGVEKNIVENKNAERNDDKVFEFIDKSIKLNNKRVSDSLLNRGKSLRNETKELDEIYFTYNKQIEILNIYFLNNDILNNYILNNDNNDNNDNTLKLLRSELTKKINSYKNQDLCKNIYNSNTIISINDVVEKLVSSKLKCYYCLKNVLLFYKNVRDDLQWTLDRIDNDKDHSNDNTIIACLKCNLQRRRRDKDIFLFSKQLKIRKV